MENKTLSEKERGLHWNTLYENKDHTKVFWHQSKPNKSVDIINKYANSEMAIIDAGCGASSLVDNLVKEGYKDITLLDISNISLDIVRARIDTKNIDLVCSDILNYDSDKKFDIWHDRAVFHFLLNKEDRVKYFEVLDKSLKNNAVAIISTFRTGGPNDCAGLDTLQFDNEKILKELPNNFELIQSDEYTHITPKNTEQEYIYFIIRKLS